MAKSLFITNIKPNHEAMVDFEILNPGCKQSAIAEAVGVSESHCSVVYHSDAFIAYRAARLQQHHQNVSETVVEKTENLAKLGLDILHDRFESEHNTVPLGGVKDTVAMALGALGFGNQHRGTPAPGVTINLGATPELLEAARERIKVINATPEVVENEEGTPIPALPAA